MRSAACCSASFCSGEILLSALSSSALSTISSAAEFSARGVPQAELVARLEAVHDLVPGVVSALSHDVLDAHYPEPMFGGPITTRQFLVHLNGHLNYHLGQIDYLRRATTGAGALELTSRLI